jgi:hypothetical protein
VVFMSENSMMGILTIFSVTLISVADRPGVTSYSR